MHGGGDCGGDVAGSEDGFPCRFDAGEAAVGAAGGRDGVNDCDRGDAEFDEHRLAEIYPDADSGERAGIADGREGGTRVVYVSGENLRAD